MKKRASSPAQCKVKQSNELRLSSLGNCINMNIRRTSLHNINGETDMTEEWLPFWPGKQVSSEAWEAWQTARMAAAVAVTPRRLSWSDVCDSSLRIKILTYIG